MATARAWGLRGSEWRTQPRSRPACPASKNKRNKVSSTPEVSGTRHKPGPDASGFSIAIDLGTRLHRSWVPASKRKGCPALLGKTSVSPRSTGLGQLFLPVRAQRPGRSGIRRSVGAAPSRNGERSWADREHARPVPGRMKARHLPKCNGATSKPPRKRRYRLTPMFFLAMPRGRAAPGDPPHLPMGSPGSLESCGPQTSQTLPRANRPPRRRLLWARSGAAFRAALGQGKGRSASAHS